MHKKGKTMGHQSFSQQQVDTKNIGGNMYKLIKTRKKLIALS